MISRKVKRKTKTFQSKLIKVMVTALTFQMIRQLVRKRKNKLAFLPLMNKIDFILAFVFYLFFHRISLMLASQKIR